jgi:hypothetical protein
LAAKALLSNLNADVVEIKDIVTVLTAILHARFLRSPPYSVETCFGGPRSEVYWDEEIGTRKSWIRWTMVSAYLGRYCSYEGFVESASLVQVHHGVSAGFAT